MNENRNPFGPPVSGPPNPRPLLGPVALDRLPPLGPPALPPLGPPALPPLPAPNLEVNHVRPVHFNGGECIIDLTTTKQQILQRFSLFLQKKIKQSNRAFIYYTILYHLMLAPIALLSICVSIIAFIITSEVFNSETNRYLSLTIGIIGIVIAAGHSAISYLEFDVKRNNFLLQKDMCHRFREKIEFSDLISLPRRDLIKKLEHYLDKINRFVKYRFPSFLQAP